MAALDNTDYRFLQFIIFSCYSSFISQMQNLKKRQLDTEREEREREMRVGLAAAGTHKSPASAKAPAPMCRN